MPNLRGAIRTVSYATYRILTFCVCNDSQCFTRLTNSHRLPASLGDSKCAKRSCEACPASQSLFQQLAHMLSSSPLAQHSKTRAHTLR